jgi:hypothetical protein
VIAVPRGWSAAISRLADADARLGAPRWSSLAPDRVHARSLVAIGHALRETEPAAEESGGAALAFAEGLAAVALAMHDAFPDNVLGDLDHLAASLWRDAAAAPEGASELVRRQYTVLVELQHLFGRATAIRFRYAHDFLYGFDWAKWVSGDPAVRAHAGPFSAPFLSYMHARGHELLAAIAEGNDRRYPPLPDARPRNAFGFSREPTDELRLHRHLAREGLLPVQAWRFDASPCWDRPFHQLRSEHAARLGLLDPGGATRRVGV